MHRNITIQIRGAYTKLWLLAKSHSLKSWLKAAALWNILFYDESNYKEYNTTNKYYWIKLWIQIISFEYFIVYNKWTKVTALITFQRVKKILTNVLTALTSQLLISGLQVLKPLNNPTHQSATGMSVLLNHLNNHSISVTAETFHPPIGPYFFPPSDFSYSAGLLQYSVSSARTLAKLSSNTS